MSRTVIYLTYTIASSPVPDPQTGQWRLRISISWDKDGTQISHPYWMPIAYASELEADIHGIAFGQCIIDGKVAGLSLHGE